MEMTDELSARAIHERHMRESLEYRREYERTRFANDVAVRVVKYRAEHGLSQMALARLLGMHQSAIARLEAGEHEPSLTTLSRLSQVLGEDFSVDITPDRMALRSAAGLSCATVHPQPVLDNAVFWPPGFCRSVTARSMRSSRSVMSAISGGVPPRAARSRIDRT